jgi:phosphatidylglycerol:prolipoprotein diacylglycerol transferase
MAIPFPGIDTVAIRLGPVDLPGIGSVGPLQIRWYGLAYLAGLLLGWLYMRRLLKMPELWRGPPPMKPEQVDDFLLWATLGTVVGGRLGFILLYEPSLFLQNPARIFTVWEGGMAFHGGLIGVVLAIVLFARANKVPLLSLGDLAAAAVPFGLFFGRLANFINGEMYGRLTDMPWAVEFPARLLDRGHAFGPRHPTQIYEALLEGVVLFLILRYFTHSRHALKEPGFTGGLFLFGYGVARIGVEFFKEWDTQQFFTTAYFSEGMIYSLPMLLFGALLMARAVRRQTIPA